MSLIQTNMLVILSPAKTQDFTTPAPSPFKAVPHFAKQVETLIHTLKQYSPQALESLLGVSPKLAALNFERYLEFNPQHYTPANSKACIFAYQGDVYQGLQAQTFNRAQLEFANEHLVILSGLYGALRPLDAIQPYRLEMANALTTAGAKDLYAFWHDALLNYFQECLATEKILVNLASNEYSRALDFKALNAKVIQIDFKDWQKNQFKIVGLFAKKARGMMARFIIKNQIQHPEALKAFNEAGYAFVPEHSSDTHYIFQRKQAVA